MRFISYFYDYSSSSSTKKNNQSLKGCMFRGIHPDCPDSVCAAIFEAHWAIGRKKSFNLAIENSSKLFGTSWGCHCFDVTAELQVSTKMDAAISWYYHDPLYPPSKGFPRFPRLKKTRKDVLRQIPAFLWVFHENARFWSCPKIEKTTFRDL